MNENWKACGAKRGKRRSLPQSELCSNTLHSISRYCLLLSILLLSTVGHEAAPIHTRMQEVKKGSRIRLQKKRRYLQLTSNNLHEPAMARMLSEPCPTTRKQNVPEKPSLEQETGDQAPERNETISQFSVELSVAIVDNIEQPNETHLNMLLAIVNALDTVIVNDTDYELYSTYNTSVQSEASNETAEGVPSRWVYTLKQENETAKERENATFCDIVGTNETIMVTWVKAVINYLILPERRAMNDTHENDHDDELYDEDSYDDESPQEENIFEDHDPLMGHTDMQRTIGRQWDCDTVGSTIMNATIKRIDDRSILEWVQQHDLSVVGVSQVGFENLTQCFVVDMNPASDVPIPFVDPLDLASWNALQTLGSIMFFLTLVGTSSLCLIGRNRSKAIRIEQWSAMIGNEAAVNDFLHLSSQFLPPECIYQRDENAAVLVTIPAAETEAHYPMNADGTACHASNH